MDGTRNYYQEAEKILKKENPEMDSYSMFVRLQEMKRNEELRDYVEKKNREAHRTEELYHSEEKVAEVERTEEKDPIGRILESASPEFLRNIHDAEMKEQAEMVLYYHALNKWKDKDMADALAYDMSDNLEYSDFEGKPEPDFSILDKYRNITRDEPHPSIVILKSEHDMDNLSDILNKSVQDFADDRAQGKGVPEIALLDENRAALGKMPIDKYLEEKVQADSKSSLAMLIDSINNGTTSITHSDLPEACFTVLEDGDSKGQVAWAGSIIGEEKFEANRNMDMTVVYYSQMDNTLVKETALSGEREAVMLEAYEEKIDLMGGMSFAELDAAESEKMEAKMDFEASHPIEEEEDKGEFFTPYSEGWEPADEFEDDEY